MHPKSGLYKIDITGRHKNLTEILELAKTKQPTQTIMQVHSDELVGCVKETIDNLPDITNLESYPQYLNDLFGDMTPCLKKLWNTDRLSEGTRHTSILILATFFYVRGASRERLFELFSSHALYKTIPREYTKIINSICRKITGREIGCKTGVHAELLQSLCQSPCWFKDKHSDFIGVKDGGLQQLR
jgi:hypothetical protein